MLPVGRDHEQILPLDEELLEAEEEVMLGILVDVGVAVIEAMEEEASEGTMDNHEMGNLLEIHVKQQEILEVKTGNTYVVFPVIVLDI